MTSGSSVEPVSEDGRVLIADGGGLAVAVLVPIRGGKRVAHFLARANRVQATPETTTVWLSGAPADRIAFDGEVSAAVSLVVEDGRVTRIYLMRNPQKLMRFEEARTRSISAPQPAPVPAVGGVRARSPIVAMIAV
jgi:hypothetical protein